MESDDHVARVPRDIADLVPEFRNNRQRELARLRECFDSKDFEAISQIAHRMIGVGAPYGFPYITEQARKLRAAASLKEAGAIRDLLDDLESYLRRVKVVIE
jgi:hypothetical protein